MNTEKVFALRAGTVAVMQVWWNIGATIAMVPILWSVLDVSRRPPSQFTPGRKAMWAISMGFGWWVLWPMAVLSAIIYLTILRPRLNRMLAEQNKGGEGSPSQSHATQSSVTPKQLPPPGWYRDPHDASKQRWWDGRGWSTLVREPSDSNSH